MTGDLSILNIIGKVSTADALLVRSSYSETGKNMWVDNDHCLHHGSFIRAIIVDDGSIMGIIEDLAAVRAANAIEAYICSKMQCKCLRNDISVSILDDSHTANNGICVWTIVLDPIFTYLGRVMRVDKARFELAASSLRTKRSNRADLLAHEKSR